MIPVVASNRFGTEILLNEDGSEKQRITFYGRSFITNESGAMVAEAVIDENPITILTSTIHPEANCLTRLLAWGLCWDRRPELYGIEKSKDGTWQ
jgi:N-carbamoylputrescine amidase